LKINIVIVSINDRQYIFVSVIITVIEISLLCMSVKWIIVLHPYANCQVWSS